METLTADEFKKKYGVIATSQFDLEEKKEGLFAEIKQAFAEGIGRVGQGFNDARPIGGGGVGDAALGVTRILGGAAEAAISPLAPVLNRTIGPAINAVSDKIADIPAVQKFAQSPAGQTTSKVAEGVANLSNAAGLVAGGVGGVKAVPTATSKVSSAVQNIPKMSPKGVEAAQYVREAARDVIPSSQRLIDTNLAKALDLTPGDLRTIAASTGNELGRWMADNNLIGTNKANTQGLIESFFKKNYEAVRGEISAVEQIYKATQVPRFQETLKAIAAETQGRLGLEKVNREISSLLKKEEVTLLDVQRVKELLDEHFSLYKATGDVATGVAKEGLANVRNELKTFIEQQVKENTGADIRTLNNNVATARTLGDAITARDPRGLTRANISWRDAMVGLGVYAFATPVVGLAAVLAFKLATSPTARLRFARWLDQRSDAQKVKINEAFKRGEVPKEVEEAVGGLEDIQMGEPLQRPKDNLPVIPFEEGAIPKTMPTLEKIKPTGKGGVSAQRADTSGPFEGVKVYRGDSAPRTNFDSDGITWFSSSKDDALDYNAAHITEANITLKNPADLDSPKVAALLKKNGIDATDLYDLSQQGPKVKAILSKEGYDGIKIERPDLEATHYAAFNPKSVSSPSIPKELEPLAAEARKYKSAEEFAETLRNANVGEIVQDVPVSAIRQSDFYKSELAKAQKDIASGTYKRSSSDPIRLYFDPKRGDYEMVDGYHRLAKALAAGKERIKSSIETFADKQYLTDFFNKVKGGE